MSETSAESLRVPPVRPPSCISMLAERLKCSNLNDLGVDRSEARFVRRSTRRPKAVNFSNDEICDIIPNISQQRSSTTSSDVDGSPITCDSGNEDSSESWIGGISLSSSSRAPDGFSFGPNSTSSYQPTLQHCLSTSAPDGQAVLFPPSDAGNWCEASAAGDRKSCCFCQHRLGGDESMKSSEDVASRHQPPVKRSCRSQSASSNQKLSASRRTIARPIALRVSQRALYSPAIAGSNPSNLSSAAYALVASGCVKLRNGGAVNQLNSAGSRLSWHHPIACGSSGSANRRFVIHPGFSNGSRHSVVIGGSSTSGLEFVGDVKLRKPPSLACISTSASSNPADFSHNRLSAFTPTTQSRRMSLSGDKPDVSTVNPIPAFFSPDTVSSPCVGVGILVPSHSTAVSLPRPTVSAASSGFFQDICSLSHSSCSNSTNSSDPQPSSGLTLKPSDDSSGNQQHHNCSIEASKSRCQSQPACAAGVPPCCCGSVASAECLSRQVGLKRRRCSHDVGLLWEADNGAFLFGSHQHVGSFDASSSSFNPDLGVTNSETVGLIFNQETVSVSPQLRSQSDMIFPQDSESAFLMSCRRKELSGLSEASEEEESNEAALLQQQYPSCCALEDYDAGTLTPPPQTRFRPIAPVSSSEEDDDENGNLHHHHHSCSTEGSPCSFKATTGNIVLSSEEGEEDSLDEDDSFGAIAPCLNHRRRYSPMQTEEASDEKFRELDMDMIEQD
ncbi:hypothetical protein ACTXT7_006509 [Hymenolepis weldensis]